MKPHIVLVRSLPCDPEPRLDRVVKVLVDMNCRCSILAWDRLGTSQSYERRSDHEIVERSQIKAGFGTGLRNLWTLLRWQFWVFRRLRALRPDVVHACDLDALLPASIYCKVTGTKLVYDIYDFFAESRRVGPLGPTLRFLEQRLSRSADMVVLAHEARLAQLDKSGSEVPVTIVYNSPPDVLGQLTTIESGRAQYFAHVGNLGSDRGLDTMCDAFNGAVGGQLIVGGYGEMEETVRLKSEQLSGVSFVGRLSHVDAIRLQAHSVAIIALYDPLVPNNRLAAPNKAYEAMMLGKPLITNAGTLLADEVRKAGIGLTVPFGSVPELQAAVQWIMDHPVESEMMGKRARSLYLERYSAAAMTTRIRSIYEPLLMKGVHE